MVTKDGGDLVEAVCGVGFLMDEGRERHQVPVYPDWVRERLAAARTTIEMAVFKYIAKTSPLTSALIKQDQEKSVGDLRGTAYLTEYDLVLGEGPSAPVSYTHLTLPTNREV